MLVIARFQRIISANGKTVVNVNAWPNPKAATRLIKTIQRREMANQSAM